MPQIVDSTSGLSVCVRLETGGFVVEAPAFMRGKERFSAPAGASTLITGFSP